MSQDGKQMAMMMGMMGICMALMLGVGVYVMRQEGDKTREEMRRGMQEAGVGVQAATKESIEGGVKDGVGQAKGAIEELTGGLIGTLNELGKSRPGSKDQDSNESKTDDERSRPEDGDAKSAKKPDLKEPADIVGGLFNLGNEVMKKADDAIQKKVELKPDEEQELGKEIHESLMKSEKYRFSEDQALIGRVEDAAVPFLSRLLRQDMEYTFSVIDDDEINAFSLPGGYIYVHKGLLDFVQSDNELMFVIGHEIGHVDLGHCARSYSYAARSRGLTGGLSELPFLTIYSQYALAFSEAFEHEADSYSVKRMTEAGEPVEGAVTFNERLLEHEREKGIAVDDEKPKSIPGAIVAGIDSHFRSHPPTQQRIDRLKRITKQSSR